MNSKKFIVMLFFSTFPLLSATDVAVAQSWIKKSCPSSATSLGKSFYADIGWTYIAKLPGIKGDSSANPNASNLILCEDGKVLSPAHSQHETIRQIGKGAYSHWGEQIYFTASDNSNPNKNGRAYTYYFK